MSIFAKILSQNTTLFHMIRWGSSIYWAIRQRVPDSWGRDAECFGLEIDPCHRLIE